MKKIVLLIVLALVSTTAIQAQEVRMGIKGGVNFATLSGDNLGDIKSRTGFHIGGLVEVPLSEQFSIQPEILYSTQGARYQEKGTELGVEYDFKTTAHLDYIQVPVMAKFYVIEGLAVEAGPEVAFLTSSKGKYEGKIGGVTVSEEDDLDDIAKVDFGVGLGVSYRLPVGVFFGARYNLGLTNINDAADDNQKIRNNVFQLSAGYSF